MRSISALFCCWPGFLAQRRRNKRTRNFLTYTYIAAEKKVVLNFCCIANLKFFFSLLLLLLPLPLASRLLLVRRRRLLLLLVVLILLLLQDRLLFKTGLQYRDGAHEGDEVPAPEGGRDLVWEPVGFVGVTFVLGCCCCLANFL